MLTGERIKLRALERRDLEKRYAWLNDWKIMRYYGSFGFRVKSYEEIKQWYEERIADNYSDYIELSIETLTGKYIGWAILSGIDWKNQVAEFRIVIGDKDYWSEGYGQEATQLMLSYAFEELNLNRVFLRVDHRNVGGIKAYEKSGFVREGVLRQEIYSEGEFHDNIIMAILKEEYNRFKNKKSKDLSPIALKMN